MTLKLIVNGQERKSGMPGWGLVVINTNPISLEATLEHDAAFCILGGPIICNYSGNCSLEALPNGFKIKMEDISLEKKAGVLYFNDKPIKDYEVK